MHGKQKLKFYFGQYTIIQIYMIQVGIDLPE